jgi:hypothetical protein
MEVSPVLPIIEIPRKILRACAEMTASTALDFTDWRDFKDA